MMNTPTNLRANLYTYVKLELVFNSGESEQMTFLIVPDADAEYYSGYLGESTPLAKAILGRTAGISVPYHKGDIYQVRILSVQPGSKIGASEAAAKRHAETEEAEEETARTNAINFAASVEGKWGEYDADSLEKIKDARQKENRPASASDIKIPAKLRPPEDR
jgi:hypothetical protein